MIQKPIPPHYLTCFRGGYNGLHSRLTINSEEYYLFLSNSLVFETKIVSKPWARLCSQGLDRSLDVAADVLQHGSFPGLHGPLRRPQLRGHDVVADHLRWNRRLTESYGDIESNGTRDGTRRASK